MYRRRLMFLLFYAAAAAVIALLMGQSNWLSYYRLSNDGIDTEAVVTKKSCENNSSFSYLFTVGGLSIEGSGSDGNGNPLCKALKPGDHVQVSYLAAAPQTNLPGNPKERLGKETAGIAAAALLLPPLLLFFLFLTLRRKQP